LTGRSSSNERAAPPFPDELPENLGLAALVAWAEAKFGPAPAEYWKAFRQAAIKVRMRTNADVEFQLAARPHEAPTGGFPMSFDDIADAVSVFRRMQNCRSIPARAGRFHWISSSRKPGGMSRTSRFPFSAEDSDRVISSRNGSYPARRFRRLSESVRSPGWVLSGRATLAWPFVNADDILPRRRFTAAHELGHAVLHRERMGRYRADEKIAEGADQPDDGWKHGGERFAAELLMAGSRDAGAGRRVETRAWLLPPVGSRLPSRIRTAR